MDAVSIDPTELAKFAADTLDYLEKDEDLDDTAELLDAVIVIEVQTTNGNGEPVSHIHTYSLEGRNTVAVGILYRGLKSIAEPD